MSSLFTKIINKEIPAEIIYEDNDILAFNDIEVEDKEILGKIFLVAKKIAKKLKIDETGYRTVFNCNEDGGQSVYHIHLHLLGGRKLNWPPG